MSTTGYSIAEIAQAVQGRVEGSSSERLVGVAGLEEASQQHVSFFHNVKYGEALKKTRAGAVIIPEKIANDLLPVGKTVIRVENPQFAYAHVLALFDRGRVQHPRGIHPTAIIDPEAVVQEGAALGAYVVVARGAHIGRGTTIYPGCFIGERATIGANALLYPHVTVREDTIVGERVIIHAGVVLGADGYGFATQKGIHHKIPQIGNVVIEDDVEIGANVAIDRATTGSTRIGQGTKIDNLVHIAHNVQVGKNCLIVAQVGISGSTKVGNQVTIAGQVGIVGHITIGDNAVITAQSGVIGNVEPGEVLFGTPARPHKEIMKALGVFYKLPEMYKTLQELKKKLIS